MSKVFVPSMHSAARTNATVDLWSDVLSGKAVLKKGDTGLAVSTVNQYLLQKRLYTWPNDSSGTPVAVNDSRVLAFSDATDAAVRAFQTANKLTVDGVVGKYTANALAGSPLPAAPPAARAPAPPPSTSMVPVTTSTEPEVEEGLTDKPWFWPVVIGVSLATVGGVLALVVARSGGAPAPAPAKA